MNSKANAVQNFTQSGSLARVSQRGVLALMLGTVALPVSGAWAQQVLSGAQTTTQSPTVAAGSPLVVTTASGFSVDTTGPLGGGGVGIDLYSRGGISFTDTNQSAITGIYGGINAVNRDQTVNGVYPRNSVTITTTGVVTGKKVGSYDGDGIQVTNEYGGDLTISVASVMGAGNGTAISAQGVLNTGALTITATGAVGVETPGANGAGIIAINEGTDLTISAATVSNGISAKSKGSGLLSITTTGEVTRGIQATNYQYGTSLTINAAKVSGNITATQQGTGALAITASDDVNAQYSDGIYASNSATATSLTISATSVSGNANGIHASNLGSGALSVTTTGAVSGGSGYKGIDASNYGTDLTISAAAVTGGTTGIAATNYGTGALSITATEAVTGTTARGISAGGYGTDLTISAAAVTGGTTGISAANYGTGALSITATGAVTGTSGEGIYAYIYGSSGTDLTISATSVSGGTFGINASTYKSTGALTITTTGAVTGAAGTGIYADMYGGGTDLTISAAAVTGGNAGIIANSKGTGALDITATGAVTGSGSHGISALGYGTDVTISATSVYGYRRGVSVKHYGTGALSITTTGAVTGSGNHGIYAFGKEYGTDLTISATSVSGYGKGIFAKNKGKGELAITTTGAVTSTNDDGIYAYGKGTDLTIAATSVSGSSNGIIAKNKGTGALEITTTGTVSGAGDYSDGIGATNYGTDLTISVNSVSGGKYNDAVLANNKGSGKLSITVSGAVVAGASSQAGGIQTRSAAGGEVAIHLLSTSSVSGASAITDNDGDAVVTIDAGALVTGDISLEYGNDTLTIASGVDLSGVTYMFGGEDDSYNAKDYTDTLNISSGWSGLLIDWEVINADTSGGDFALNGFTLGDRSFSKTGAGTLTLNGAMTLAAESTLTMGVPQDWADPLILATDEATIAGDLVVTPGQALTFGQEYTLIEARALTGTFGDVSVSGGYKTTLRYTDTSVLLRFDPNSLLELGGDSLSPNARAVAAAFDAAVDGGFDPQAFANLYTQADTLNAKLHELSGELHSAERRAALDDTRVVRDAALDRLGGGLTGGAGGTFWAQGLGSWGTADADGTGAKITTQLSGVLMGVDFAQGDITYGGMFSYTNSGVDLASLGHSDVTSTGAAAYAGYRHAGSGLAFGMGGALASTSAKGQRSISITGLEQTLTSTAQGTSYQVFGEVSNDLAKAGNVQIEPFARLAYAKVDSDAFAETGGSAALSGAAQSNDLRTASFGLRGAYVAGSTTLSGSAAWQHSAGDLSAPTTLSMAGVDTPYEVNSAALDQNAIELAAQASIQLSSGAVLAGGYSGKIGKTNSTHGLRVTLSMAW